jgi:hypothetical protein
VLRRLSEHGYRASYNASGRYLTVDEVADFDSRGLWSFRSARFALHGTLKETIIHFVASGPSGMTHDEVSGLLGVRVHNTLRELVREGRIARELLGGVFVYVAAAGPAHEAQVEARSRDLGEPAIRPTSGQVIAVLLELVKDPGVSRDGIVSRSHGVGVKITRTVVDAIFSRYDLEKKRAP